MTISSAQVDCSITSSDTITLTNSTASSIYYTGNGIGNVTISNGGYSINTGGAGSTVTLGGAGSVTASSFIWKTPEEFVDSLPDFDRVQKMCEEYPGLKIAYEKFVTTYKLVKDDYDTPKDKRPKP